MFLMTPISDGRQGPPEARLGTRGPSGRAPCCPGDAGFHQACPPSASRADGRLSLCSAGGAQVPLPFSPAGGTEPRALVWAGPIIGTCALEQVTCRLLGARSRALDPVGSLGGWPCSFCISWGRQGISCHFTISRLEDQSIPNYSSLAARVPRWELVRTEKPHRILLGLPAERGVACSAGHRRRGCPCCPPDPPWAEEDSRARAPGIGRRMGSSCQDSPPQLQPLNTRPESRVEGRGTQRKPRPRALGGQRPGGGRARPGEGLGPSRQQQHLEGRAWLTHRKCVGLHLSRLTRLIVNTQ